MKWQIQYLKLMAQNLYLTEDQIPLKGELISKAAGQKKISRMKHKGTKDWKYWRKWKIQRRSRKKLIVFFAKVAEAGKKGRRRISRDNG